MCQTMDRIGVATRQEEDHNKSYYSTMNALCHIVSLCKDVLMLMMFGIVRKYVQMLQINYTCIPSK